MKVNTQPRQCGDCEVCCYVGEVKEGIVQKPSCQKCPFQDHGCKIYGQPERPTVCSSFQCSWLRGYGAVNDRPDKSGVMVSVNRMNGGTWINVMELNSNAYKTTGKSIILDVAAKVDLPVIIITHNHLKHGRGDYVIVKESLKPRSKKIMGNFIATYAPGFDLYKLVISSG